MIIRGLGSTFDNNPGGGDTQRELEAQGYEVEVINYRQSIPGDKSDYEVVVGFSAGATRAELEFQDTDTQVYSMGSPTHFKSDNIQHVSNIADPVALLGFVIGLPFMIAQDGKETTFFDLSSEVHSMDNYFDELF